MADNRTMYSPLRQLGPPDTPAKLIRCRRRLLGRHAGQRQPQSQTLRVSTASRHPYRSIAISFGLTRHEPSYTRFPAFSPARKPEVTRERLDVTGPMPSRLGKRTFRFSRSDKNISAIPKSRRSAKLRWRDARFLMHKLNMPAYRPNAAIILRNSCGEILVCERSDWWGCWQFPQGRSKEGRDACSMRCTVKSRKNSASSLPITALFRAKVLIDTFS